MGSYCVVAATVVRRCLATLALVLALLLTLRQVRATARAQIRLVCSSAGASTSAQAREVRVLQNLAAVRLEFQRVAAAGALR